ncbi:MAG: hypothetical protein IMW89_16235 [Ktedonobacteraceae bacterium]|nr:hypothetical protein [Ktedonobacteraceae bacterium]
MRTIARPHPVIRGLQFVYVFLAWLYALGLAVQVYLAGLGIFSSSTWLETHAALGHSLFFGTILVLILAAVARFPRAIILLNVLLFVLVFVQVSLVTWVYVFHLPPLTALHPVNALLLFFTAIITAYRAYRHVMASRGAETESGPSLGSKREQGANMAESQSISH